MARPKTRVEARNAKLALSFLSVYRVSENGGRAVLFLRTI